MLRKSPFIHLPEIYPPESLDISTGIPSFLVVSLRNFQIAGHIRTKNRGAAVAAGDFIFQDGHLWSARLGSDDTLAPKIAGSPNKNNQPVKTYKTIWGWVKTYDYHFWRHNHPLTSFFLVPRVSEF